MSSFLPCAGCRVTTMAFALRIDSISASAAWTFRDFDATIVVALAFLADQVPVGRPGSAWSSNAMV